MAKYDTDPVLAQLVRAVDESQFLQSTDRHRNRRGADPLMGCQRSHPHGSAFLQGHQNRQLRQREISGEDAARIATAQHLEHFG